MSAQSTHTSTAANHGWNARTETPIDGTIIRYTRDSETVRVRYTAAGNVSAAFYSDTSNHTSNHLGTRTPNKRETVTAWLSNALSDTVIRELQACSDCSRTGTIVDGRCADCSRRTVTQERTVNVWDLSVRLAHSEFPAYLSNYVRRNGCLLGELTARDIRREAERLPMVATAYDTREGVRILQAIADELDATVAGPVGNAAGATAQGPSAGTRSAVAFVHRAARRVAATLAAHSDGYTIGVDGSVPNRGCAVAIADSLILHSVDVDAIAQYVESHSSEYVSGRNSYFGIWEDIETGLVYVDTVRVMSQRAAIRIARARNEIAVWDFTQGEIRVNQNDYQSPIR